MQHAQPAQAKTDGGLCGTAPTLKQKVFNDRLIISKHESCAYYAASVVEIQDATEAELNLLWPGSSRARLLAASQACMLKASE